MLGDKVAKAAGKVTSRRVLRNGDGSIRVETSFDSSGKLLGVDVREHGTYWSAPRADGSLYGEGQGIMMGKSGEMATWLGQGVGTVRKDGGVNFRGAVYYSTASAAWTRLNSVAVVFEYSVDGKGNTKVDAWEWK